MAAKLGGVFEHAVEADENGELQQQRQAAAEWVHAVVTIQLHHLHLLLLWLVFILLLQLLHHRGQQAHALHGAHGFGVDGPDAKTDENGEEDHRHAPVPRDAVHPAHHADEDDAHRLEPAVKHRVAALAVRFLVDLLEAVILLRAEVNLIRFRFASAGGQIDDREAHRTLISVVFDGCVLRMPGERCS